MNKKYILILGLMPLLVAYSLIKSGACCNDEIVSVKPTQFAKVPMAIIKLGTQSSDSDLFVELIAHDLSWSGHVDVHIEAKDTLPSKKQIMTYADQGIALALFIEREVGGKSFDWRLYDTMQPAMIKGKRLTKKGPDARQWSHELCDIIWPLLTGQDGFFSSKIAYCKEVKCGNRRPRKHLVVADYDGSNKRVLVPTVTLAPRWGNDILFYSESTNSNVRLMYLDARGKPHTAANFDGITMLPTVSEDGSKSIYCASRGRGSCQLYYSAPGIFKQFTHNNGTNVSPTITPDGSKVYFCSDFRTGHPAIYVADVPSGTPHELIANGLCPSYSSKTNKIAYIKNCGGFMQVFTYDISTKRHEQMTFDRSNKDECSWSSCGNYLIFSRSAGTSSRIVVLNTLSKEQQFVTDSSEVCTYPAWSLARGFMAVDNLVI